MMEIEALETTELERLLKEHSQTAKTIASELLRRELEAKANEQ